MAIRPKHAFANSRLKKGKPPQARKVHFTTRIFARPKPPRAGKPGPRESLTLPMVRLPA